MDAEFTSVSEAERERAIGTLVLAFAADPFFRWIYPDASQYLSRFPEALQAFGGVAFGQGTRLGSRLMTPSLEIVDREHLPAYLDSTNPRNMPFYERHGFEVTGSGRPVTVPRSSPCSGNLVSRSR